MIFCLNPACPSPENPDDRYQVFCRACGKSLNPNLNQQLFHRRYRVLNVLGEGAFGRTYKVADVNFQGKARVLKKFIAQGQGATFQKIRALFYQEAEKLDELKHEQIPTVYDYFEDENSLYLVQEFIEGENLLTELKYKGQFNEAKIREILLELLPILQYIHDQNLLHRDIKPENILRRYGDKKLVLIDFGGVQNIAEMSGIKLYTPGYAAIEQMAGNPQPSSDIYSLGATCVRLLTGCFPAEDTGLDEICNVQNMKWRWKERLKDQGIFISTKLTKVLDKMLQSSTKKRYVSANEVLKDLRNTSSREFNFKIFFSCRKVKTLIASVRTRFSKSRPSPKETLSLSSIPDSPNPLPLETKTFTIITVNKRGEVIDQETRSVSYFSEDLGHGINLEMIAIPAGRFIMGSIATEKGSENCERPQRDVDIHPFYMSQYPITQAQWRSIALLPKIGRQLEPNPSSFMGDNRPVERVSWYSAEEFCKRLSKQTGKDYRLPSEAQWEYACKAGTHTPFYFGETLTGDLANYDAISKYSVEPKGIYRKETTPVGLFLPNAFGLYDMHGNVWEWCEDDWHNNYQGAPVDGGAWLDKTDNGLPKKCLRGGSWGSFPADCRSAARSADGCDNGSIIRGFRVVLVERKRYRL